MNPKWHPLYQHLLMKNEPQTLSFSPPPAPRTLQEILKDVRNANPTRQPITLHVIGDKHVETPDIEPQFGGPNHPAHEVAHVQPDAHVEVWYLQRGANGVNESDHLARKLQQPVRPFHDLGTSHVALRLRSGNVAIADGAHLGSDIFY